MRVVSSYTHFMSLFYLFIILKTNVLWDEGFKFLYETCTSLLSHILLSSDLRPKLSIEDLCFVSHISLLMIKDLT